MASSMRACATSSLMLHENRGTLKGPSASWRNAPAAARAGRARANVGPHASCAGRTRAFGKGSARTARMGCARRPVIVKAVQTTQPEVKEVTESLSEAEMSEIQDKAVSTSNVLNVVQILTKVAAYNLSGGSNVVLATLLDSFLSAVAGVVITIAVAAVNSRNEDDDVTYPVGKARMEPVGIVTLSAMVCTATTVVILEDVGHIYEFLTQAEEHAPTAGGTLGMGVVGFMLAGVGLKWWLRTFCTEAADKSKSAIVGTLAMDHRNDSVGTAFSLAMAAITAYTGYEVLDAVGSTTLCCFILYSYLTEAFHTMDKLSNKGAPKDMVSELRAIAESHHPDARIDCLRAYHFGEKFLLEVECIVDPEMQIAPAHAIALSLQYKLEEHPEIERCFVHLDHVIDGVFYGKDDSGLSERSMDLIGSVRADALERSRDVF